MNDANRLLERSCVVCGADLQIVLEGDNNIVSGGYYFSTRLDEGESEWEYWECKKCYEDSPGEQQRTVKETVMIEKVLWCIFCDTSINTNHKWMQTYVCDDCYKKNQEEKKNG